MTSFLNLERHPQPPAPEPELARPPAAAPDAAEESVEFETVMGRRQIAGAGLVAIVLLAVFSGVSYLIGKSTAAAAAATPAAVAPAPAFPIFVPQTLAATPAPTPPGAKELAKTTTAPLFGEAVTGKVYLQVGAIEKGLAAIWVEGLRTHGLDAFVAPGPGDKQWRVLIGPLPDPPAYQRAKDTLDTLGLTNFGRRYPPQ